MASQPSSEVKRPPHWDKLVSAAYLRIMGATQNETAKGVGRSLRTIQLWEAQKELWQAARAEARDRWLSDVVDASRSTVLKAVRSGNAELGFTIIERVDDELAPPRQRHEHTGEDGGPMEVTVTRRVVASPKNRMVHAGANGNGNGNGRHA